MTFARRNVIIPLAAPGGKAGRIAYVHAGGAKPLNDAKLIPEIALLNDCKLYPAGAIALAAVRQLALAAPCYAPSQWLGLAGRPAYLSASNAPELYGLTPENSASAQLGLALAIVMYRAQTRIPLAIATGRLETKTYFECGEDQNGVPVKPVGLIGEKLETLRQILADFKGGAFPASIPFFFPKYGADGQQLSVSYREDFERTADAYRAHGIALDLHPVSTLREALEILGVNKVKPRLWDRAAIAGAAGCILSVAGAAAGRYWLDRPIAIEFAPITLTTGKSSATPFPARQLAGGSVEQLAACFNREGMPVYPAGSWMVLRAVIRDPVSWFGPGSYHFAAVTVSETSGVKVFPPETWGGGRGGPEVSIRLPIGPVGEANKLILLARRFSPFDSEALRARAADAISGKKPEERINAAVNAMVKEGPGYLDYSFSSASEPICEGRQI